MRLQLLSLSCRFKMLDKSKTILHGSRAPENRPTDFGVRMYEEGVSDRIRKERELDKKRNIRPAEEW